MWMFWSSLPQIPPNALYISYYIKMIALWSIKSYLTFSAHQTISIHDLQCISLPHILYTYIHIMSIFSHRGYRAESILSHDIITLRFVLFLTFIPSICYNLLDWTSFKYVSNIWAKLIWNLLSDLKFHHIPTNVGNWHALFFFVAVLNDNRFAMKTH